MVWEGTGEKEKAGEVFDFIFVGHISFEFLCNQNISQKNFDLAELADSDQK